MAKRVRIDKNCPETLIAVGHESARSWRTSLSGSGSRHDTGPHAFATDISRRLGALFAVRWQGRLCASVTSTYAPKPSSPARSGPTRRRILSSRRVWPRRGERLVQKDVPQAERSPH